MGTGVDLRDQIVQVLDELPDESLREVCQFVDFLRFKRRQEAEAGSAALAGLLVGYRFTEADVAQARREMWGRVDADPG